MFAISWGKDGNQEALGLLLRHDRLQETFYLEMEGSGDESDGSAAVVKSNLDRTSANFSNSTPITRETLPR
jgi:hypothetical protein